MSLEFRFQQIHLHAGVMQAPQRVHLDRLPLERVARSMEPATRAAKLVFADPTGHRPPQAA
jgi:hypothetical protein